jgi:hypothetical protein
MFDLGFCAYFKVVFAYPAKTQVFRNDRKLSSKVASQPKRNMSAIVQTESSIQVEGQNSMELES